MSHRKMSIRVGEGVTIISLIPQDPDRFYSRLLLSGLRVCSGGGKISTYKDNEGEIIFATGPGCTGYLLGTDGVEAPESDLFRFLTAELPEGAGLNIFGRYEPEPGKTVRSAAHFRHHQGGIMSCEDRLLIGPDGSVTTLRRRSDLNYENVVSIPSFRISPGLL